MKRWTLEEKATLRQMMSDHTPEQIAAVVGRSVDGVKKALYNMGIHSGRDTSKTLTDTMWWPLWFYKSAGKKVPAYYNNDFYDSYECRRRRCRLTKKAAISGQQKNDIITLTDR